MLAADNFTGRLCTVVRGAALVALAAITFVTAGCRTSDLAFRADQRVEIVAPENRSEVTLPFDLTWSVEDFNIVGSDGSKRATPASSPSWSTRRRCRPARVPPTTRATTRTARSRRGVRTCSTSPTATCTSRATRRSRSTALQDSVRSTGRAR